MLSSILYHWEKLCFFLFVPQVENISQLFRLILSDDCVSSLNVDSNYRKQIGADQSSYEAINLQFNFLFKWTGGSERASL